MVNLGLFGFACRDVFDLSRLSQGWERVYIRGLSGWTVVRPTVRVSTSSSATSSLSPFSLMAPRTLWVEGDGHVRGVRCRRRSAAHESVVTVHVGPILCVFQGVSQLQLGGSAFTAPVDGPVRHVSSHVESSSPLGADTTGSI